MRWARPSTCVCACGTKPGCSKRREVEEQRDHQVHGEELHALVPVTRPAGRDDRSDQHGEEEQAEAARGEGELKRMRSHEVTREHERRRDEEGYEDAAAERDADRKIE